MMWKAGFRVVVQVFSWKRVCYYDTFPNFLVHQLLYGFKVFVLE